MILRTKYLDNLRPCSKQVKMIKKNNEKSLKQISEKSFSVWLLAEWNNIIPNIYLSTTNSSKVASLAYVVNFRYRFIAKPPVLLQMIFVAR